MKKIKLILLLINSISLNIFYYDQAFTQEKVESNYLSYDKQLNGYEYPFKLSKFNLESQGNTLEMSYMFLGSRNVNKGTITLLHGKNFNGSYWEELAEKLNILGYNILIPDQIGFGKSSKPYNYQYTFHALALNTKKLLRKLNIESTQLIGHSMGGMLASRFALLYPSLVTNLILINPIGLENYLQYVEYKDIDFFYRKELKLKPIKIINYQRKNYYAGIWNERYENLASHLIGWVNGKDWPYLAKISAKTYDMIFTGTVIEEFNDFTIPVSVIIGTRDRTGPGRNWKKKAINYELGRYDILAKKVKKLNFKINIQELEGLGHLPHVEDFGRFYKTLDKILLDAH